MLNLPTPIARSLTLPAFDTAALMVSAEIVGDSLSVKFHGNADMAVVDALDGYLVALHGAAVDGHFPSVTVDFRKLEFMNSSCFKCFVSWLGKVQDMPSSERYRIIFGSNRELHWQRRSLNALRCFALDVVSIAP